MPLKKSAGNMYPWVTHTHGHLEGRCPHECPYCYVQAMERRFMWGKYAGPLRLNALELHAEYGRGKTIFVEHMNDLFAVGVEQDWIADVLDHCKQFPENTYVLQTKNPTRMALWWKELPARVMLGTTIEMTGPVVGNAPHPEDRAHAMTAIGHLLPDATRFVTIEPIHDFDLARMLAWLRAIAPSFVNIGADSKRSGVVEPPPWKVRELIECIGELGIEIRQKRNLDRVLGKSRG